MNYPDLARMVHENFLGGSIDVARKIAISRIDGIFKEFHPSARVLTTLSSRTEIGVASDKHLLLSANNGAKYIHVSENLVSASFSNSLDSFQAIGTLCETHPVRRLPSGMAVIDIEDGSN